LKYLILEVWHKNRMWK